jgi:rare lipoprotein A
MGAAICGAAILFACSSAAMARTETATKIKVDASSANAADKAANGSAKHQIATAGTIVGTASMYNPFEPGYREGGIETANGERYDPSAWASAIRTDLRRAFGGVLYGAKHGYALIESAGKEVIVKINDVGPLEPGRVIDFDKQTMRYFDPTLQRGLIHHVKVTPLHGDGWTLGPVKTKIGPDSTQASAGMSAESVAGSNELQESTLRGLANSDSVD